MSACRTSSNSRSRASVALAPHLPLYSLKNEIFSRDPAVVEQMNNDPLINTEKEPAETASEVLKAAARLKENMPNLNVPVFIIHGTDDKATRPAGSQYFFDNVGSKDKTLKLYEGGYHDLLNDIDKETVMADILAWVNERVPAEPRRPRELKTRRPNRSISRRNSAAASTIPTDMSARVVRNRQRTKDEKGDQI